MNQDLKSIPAEFCGRSGKKAWWKCEKGHKWQAAVRHMRHVRPGNNGCPYCSGRKIGFGNDLASTFPLHASMWHPANNFSPSSVTPKSTKNAWWRCPEGHEWEGVIRHLVRNEHPCPYCDGRRLTPEKSLGALYPDLLKQWHPDNRLSPFEVHPQSNKKVRWKCDNGHEWEALINSRLNSLLKYGAACSFCTGRLLSEDNSLQALRPDIADEWNSKKNKGLLPSQVVPGSAKKVWWKCHKGHEWQAAIHRRASSGSQGCPYCSGRRAGYENTLVHTHPNLLKEWSNKNKYTPDKYTYGSDKKVWWRCYHGHEWLASINKRTIEGKGCPTCSPGKSNIEIRLYCELKFYFPKSISGYRIKGYEADIYVPELNLIIEYDGGYYHRNSLERDLKKYEHFTSLGYRQINVRERFVRGECFLPPVSDNDIYVTGIKPEKILEEVIREILKRFDLDVRVSDKMMDFLKYGQFFNEKEFSYWSKKPNLIGKKSVLDTQHVQHWDYEKNGDIRPENYTLSSPRKVYWKCEKGHSWMWSIIEKTQEPKCPYCTKRSPRYGKNLTEEKPEIARYWDYEKNGELTPQDVGPKSHKKVYWRCNNGHEWHQTVINMTLRKYSECYYCKNIHPGYGYSFGDKYPHKVKYWHPTKNGDLTPYGVTPMSNKKKWWSCENGHEWRQSISEMATKKYMGCPICKKQSL